MLKLNEVPQAVGEFKVCPFWQTKPRAWFRGIKAQFQLYQVKEELEKYHYLLCVIDDKVLDPLDDESKDTLNAAPYSDLKERVLDEHKVANQDKIETLFQLIEAPHIHSIDEIVSLARYYLSTVPDIREAIIKKNTREESPPKAEELVYRSSS
ncbi:unnamed protein product [Lepeophtheirus salmonis]|uniref:(salmon louse) hypothetical protein n=1 Tax=Lepeophtheirus salmonis TaxID=72036 RepID=A0A7R8H8L0_LEPSM|nr:unnamed protein product [Lepeophtheirus salmonis]CAF2941723.1 unnamed protein product [Lepeophtheirus salmonis]